MANTASSAVAVPTQVTDEGGSVIFSDSAVGKAHVMAHRMLDEGRLAEGYELLGQELAQLSGSGSQWVHLQWHMMVFEIGVGRVDQARDRFEREIARHVESGLIETDGPSALWRLHLARATCGEHLWQAMAAQASRRPVDPDGFVELHNLLAIAGIGDRATLESRLEEIELVAMPLDQKHAVVSIGRALLAICQGRRSEARHLLSNGRKTLASLQGSLAQNQLFADICDALIDQRPLAYPPSAQGSPAIKKPASRSARRSSV